MEATGLKKGGIYRHFASKEELAAAAFDYAWDSVWQARMRDVEESTRGIENLKRRIANFVERRSPIPGGCPILNTAVAAAEGNSVLRARVSKALRTWRESLETELESAAEQGEIRPGVDAKTVATLIIATLEGALMISRLERKPDALIGAKTHLYRFLDTEVFMPRAVDSLSGENPAREKCSYSTADLKVLQNLNSTYSSVSPCQAVKREGKTNQT
jgi:TetR/AcrR family transcriptional repressor of nem operon